MNMKRIIVLGMVFSVVYSFNVFGMKRKRLSESEMTDDEKRIEEGAIQDAPAQKKRKLDNRNLFPRTDELDFFNEKRDPILNDKDRSRMNSGAPTQIPDHLVRASKHLTTNESRDPEISQAIVNIVGQMVEEYNKLKIEQYNGREISDREIDILIAQEMEKVLRTNNPNFFYKFMVCITDKLYGTSMSDFYNKQKAMVETVCFIDKVNTRCLLEPLRIKVARDLILNINMKSIKTLFTKLPEGFKVDALRQCFDHAVEYARWILSLENCQEVFERLLEARYEALRHLGVAVALLDSELKLDVDKKINLSDVTGMLRLDENVLNRLFNDVRIVDGREAINLKIKIKFWVTILEKGEGEVHNQVAMNYNRLKVVTPCEFIRCFVDLLPELYPKLEKCSIGVVEPGENEQYQPTVKNIGCYYVEEGMKPKKLPANEGMPIIDEEHYFVIYYSI